LRSWFFEILDFFHGGHFASTEYLWMMVFLA
jgi:hypothetical protein